VQVQIDIVPDHPETGLLQQMADIRLASRREIIDARNVIATRDKPVAQMRPKKTSASRYNRTPYVFGHFDLLTIPVSGD